MPEAGQFRTPFDVQCFNLKAAMLKNRGGALAGPLGAPEAPRRLA